LRAFLAAALLAAAPALAQQRVVDPAAGDSARPAAMRILRYLAEGDVEAAAALSNAPQRRLEVLRGYRNSVGEEEFKRVFGRYFAPENRLIVEIAAGRHRLIVWELGEAGNRLAGQYFVEVGGEFLLDDVPSRERSELRRVLQDYRSGKLKD
jgi:hypothetical protein